MIELTTLGRCAIVRDGSELTAFLAHKQECALLVYLAMEGPVSRQRLQGLFWPGRSPERARHSLAQAVYALRRELGPEAVEVRGEQVHLRVDRVRVDARQLERAAEHGRWERVVELYRGRFLERFALPGAPGFEGWRASTADRLARLAQRAYRAVLEARESAGDRAGALARASQWAALEPLEDEPQAALIVLLARSGNRAAALEHFEAYRERRSRALAAQPGEDLVGLAERIRAGGTPEFPLAPAVETAVDTGPERAGDVSAGAAAGGPEAIGPRAKRRGGWDALLDALKGRREVQVAVGYLAFAALAMEVASNLVDGGIVSPWAFRWLLVVLIAGLPIALTVAWAQARSGVEAAAPGPGAARRVERLRGSYAPLAIAATLALVVLAGWYLLSQPSGVKGGIDVGSDGFPATNIAVWPLEDYSQQSNPALAAGITGFLTAELAKIDTLNVLSYPPMRQYQEEGLPIDSVVQRHRIGTLIEGNVIASGDEIQVAVNLIDGATLTQIASLPPLVRPRGQSPRLLTELADEVARTLRRQLGIQIARRKLEAETESAAALELYFQGTELRRVAESEIAAGDASAAALSLERADSLLAGAESLDRDWTGPSVARGEVERTRARMLSETPGAYEREAALRGIAHTDRALERRPNDADALRLRGILRSGLAEGAEDSAEAARLWAGAEADLARAVALQPSLAVAWSRLSLIYRQSGRLADAKRAAERALEEDVWYVNDETILMRLCQTSVDMEQFDEANHWCVEEGRRRFPDRAGFVSFELLLLASSVGPEPDIQKAWRLADALVALFPPHRRGTARPRALMDVAAAIARAGRADSARAVIRRARATAGRDDPELDYREANARLQLGERDEAIRLLARFLRAKPNWKAYTAKDWWWKSLRDDPRFRALVE